MATTPDTHLNETLPVELRESLDGGVGRKWAVVILKEGMSANRRHYSRRAVVGSARLFEGKWVNVDHFTDAERTARPEGTLTRRAGRIGDVRVVEVDGKAELHGVLTVVLPWVREALLNAHNEGMHDWAGLSIDAHGRVQVLEAEGGARVPTVVELVRANSVDLVTIPAAGGAVSHLLASYRGDEPMTPEEIKALVAESQQAMLTAVQEALEASQAKTVDAALTALREAGAANFGGKKAPPFGDDDDDDEDDEDDEDDDEDEDEDEEDDEDMQESYASPDALVDELEIALAQVRTLREAAQAELQNLQGHAHARRIAVGLQGLKGIPDPIADLTKNRLVEAARAGLLDDDTVAHIVETTRDAWEKAAPANADGSPSRFWGNTVRTRDQKYHDALRGAFRREDVGGVPRFQGLKEAFCAFTGSNPLRLSPQAIMREMRSTYDAGLDTFEGRLSEAMTTASWGDIFADVMHNEMLTHFNAHPEYGTWREIVSRVDSTPDFQAQNVTRWGGYANLPAVAQADPYAALSSPGDQKTSFVVGKYGGTEEITWEMVVNDDMGAIAELPGRLGYAATRGLFEFVFDMVTTDNPTLAYDSVALYHTASHANDGDYELTVAGLDATERGIMAQVPFGHPANEVLGPRGKIKFVIVSRAQRLRARALLNPSQAMIASLSAPGSYDDVDPMAFASSGIKVYEYDQLSGTDWYAGADPKLPGMNMLTIGFLGGRQTPELWVAQDPTAGSMFSHDKIMFKIRFVYGGVVPDHRGWYRNTP